MDYQKYYEKYQEVGCIKIENFLTLEEVELLKQGLTDMVKNMPKDTDIHSTSESLNNKKSEDNCIGSADKIGYFFENDAAGLDENCETKKVLKYIAHGIHWWNPECKQFTFSKKFKDLFRAFGYKDPVIFQSMLIFKNPMVGDKFEPSQDSNFFYTEPPSCICLWMPLEDTSVENGCLWFLPGSHKAEKIYQRYERNPEKDPFMILKGDLPDFDQDKYVPIPTKKDDIGILHGSTLHKGSRNNTDKPRAVYTFFAVEKDSKWSELNQGQPNENRTFTSVFDN